MGVGMYINEELDYTIVEKTSEEAFQALWIKFFFLLRKIFVAYCTDSIIHGKVLDIFEWHH